MLRFSWLAFATLLVLAAAPPRVPRGQHRVTQGSLLAVHPRGGLEMECPLKHTDVKAEITGFLARVNVTQEFENTASDKIEAVYVFPLPQNSAVDDMTLTVGDRVVKGLIKRREEARAIYEAARNSGRVAGLLDQERPNIFTQSVANIAPGAKVKITISYVENLKYEEGLYEFMFPMVVGPRYIPNSVPDASRITPPVSPTRAGHDLSLEVKLDAGLPLDSVASATHDVAIERSGANRAVIRLRDKNTIPNKDFVLRYDSAGKKIQNTVMAHRSSKGSFFTLIVQPPERVQAEQATPKEIVFVLDTSGSMSGFPIEKAKESMRYAIDELNPRDTFNLITFSGDTSILFPKPVPATPENLARAKEFLAGRHGSGGTEMMKAVRASLEGIDEQHVRIACFMTDGYVGNEDEIISEVKKHANARVFSFGIGNSVNRYLLDKMAEQGRGEVEYVGLQDDGSAAAKRFAARVRNPLLTDIQVEWGSLPVSEVYPSRIPDLFSAKPLVLTGRYSGPSKGTVRVTGMAGGRRVTMDVPVELPASEAQHDVLATLWARRKVDSLSMNGGADAKEEITKLGLDFRLMTAYTSFVAVEETTVIEGGKPRTVQVPVDIPDGVSYQGVFGEAPGQPVAAARMMYATPTFLGDRAHKTMNEAVQVTGAAPVLVQPEFKSKIAPVLLNRTGRLDVRIYLKSTSAQTLAALKQAGFELIAQPASAKVVVGRIDASKLKALSELADVIHIAPLLN